MREHRPLIEGAITAPHGCDLAMKAESTES